MARSRPMSRAARHPQRGGQSQLIALPVMAPASDRVEHTIQAQLNADGSLEARVVERVRLRR